MSSSAENIILGMMIAVALVAIVLLVRFGRETRRRAVASAEVVAKESTVAQLVVENVTNGVVRDSYQYAERLRVEVERLQNQHAGELQAAHREIQELRQKLASSRQEIRSLRQGEIR